MDLLASRFNKVPLFVARTKDYVITGIGFLNNHLVSIQAFPLEQILSSLINKNRAGKEAGDCHYKKLAQKNLVDRHTQTTRRQPMSSSKQYKLARKI